MYRRCLKIIFWAGSLVFWCISCIIVLESWERHATRHDVLFKYASPIIGRAEEQDLKIYEATLADSPRPPDEVFARYPVLETLEGASEDRLKELADQWSAIIFRCDPGGAIECRFTGTGDPMTVKLATASADAENIAFLLPEEYGQYRPALLSRLALAVEDWRNPQPPLPHMTGCLGPWVDYAIPLPDMLNGGFRFLFHPYNGQNPRSVKILLW